MNSETENRKTAAGPGHAGSSADQARPNIVNEYIQNLAHRLEGLSPADRADAEEKLVGRYMQFHNDHGELSARRPAARDPQRDMEYALLSELFTFDETTIIESARKNPETDRFERLSRGRDRAPGRDI